MKYPNSKQFPLDIVGSSTFGRDPKILSSRTFNMIEADNFLVDYGGYKVVAEILSSGEGRGLFSSATANQMIGCVDNNIYAISVFGQTLQNRKIYNVRYIGSINSFAGDVFFDENNTNQIAICDKSDIYIYDYIDLIFQKATLPEGFIPGYVTYQDGRFIAPDTNSAAWALSQVGDGLNWFWDPSGGPVLGAIQTKGTRAVATVRFPGRGNLLLVMGENVSELWTDVGGAQFPYQRSASVNIDYGCLNPATIAAQDSIIVWLGVNEKAGPTIMYSTGSDAKQISTDGINFKFEQLVNPARSTGFFMRLAGHLIYQLTFYDPRDNYSLIYDFTTQKFFDVTDENMNYHIARRVASFDNDYYFISLNDGNLYQIAADFYTYDYGTTIKNIPRKRVCSNVRLPDSTPCIVNQATMTVEQGNDVDNDGNDPIYLPNVSLSVSTNGGISFSGWSDQELNTVGHRQNMVRWWNLGMSNDFVAQFSFNSTGSWKASNGILDTYQ